jgi:hypothetical protein
VAAREIVLPVEARANPVLSILAVTLGVLLIVPPFVSYWKTWKLYPAADDPQMRLAEGTQPLAEPAPAGAPAPQGPPPDPDDRLD